MSLALLLSIDKRRPISSLLSTPQLAMTSVHCMLGRILGPASSFVMAVLLARSFGAAGSGTFFVVLTLVTAFAIVAKFGLETALQRFIGAEKARDNAAAIVGIYQQSLRASLALAALLAGLWIALASSIASSVLDDPTLLGLLRLMGLLIVPFTVLGINAAMLKALGSPAWGGFFEAAAWPLVTLSLAVLGSINGPPSIEAIGLAYLLAATLAAATAHAVVHIKLPRVPKALAMSSRTLYTSCATLTGVELINFALLWTPFILLPALADATQAGLYNVSHRLAAQLGMLMMAVASITSARFAAHYQQRQNADLAKLAGRATRTQILFGLPPGIVLLLFGEPILTVFGEEFAASTTTLQVLLIGQLFNIVTGPVGNLLAMTDHEGPLRKILLATIALMLLMAITLTPIFGATGAACAVTAAIVFHNLLCMRVVASRLGLPFFLAFSR